ncbi:MAG: tRNA (adenine-N1)-methyltransferase [Dehalococcoidia bacterium]|nr:tRNA (adenine-N1)-methyltransferase [Dehalococcoidia bacterium]
MTDERRTFVEGDLVVFIDHRGRQYMSRLAKAKVLHTHLGMLPHESVIGQEEGARLPTNTGHKLLTLRPTLAEYLLKMERGSQIIYPKDTGAILLAADIYPGARVFEAGTGSGALTLALLRAVGATGRVITYDNREDASRHAARNIEAFLGGVPENLTMRSGDIYQGIEEQGLDRMVLDVPEPWLVVQSATKALRLGGILLCFLPTVLQVHRLVMELNAVPGYEMALTLEVLQRTWHVEQRSMRPDHRMVAHTGFITTARRVQPRAQALLEAPAPGGEAAPPSLAEEPAPDP